MSHLSWLFRFPGPALALSSAIAESLQATPAARRPHATRIKSAVILASGGLIVTSRQDVAEQARMTREYGWRRRYVSDQTGVNSRLDELQAALLRVMLRHLDEDNERRRQIAERYASGLGGSGLTLPGAAAGGRAPGKRACSTSPGMSSQR